jgi:hypothetical protein
MELKLQVGWFGYVLSGFLLGVFAAALALLSSSPDTATSSQILLVVIAPIAAILAFLLGCQVKQPRKK